MLLSLTQSLLVFYILFCIGRMNFAATFDLGIYGALNSWFVARRAFVTAIANLAMMAGLVVLPFIAHLAMEADGWRAGWLAVGATVLIVGFVPTWLFMVRRPEDVGLVPDRLQATDSASADGKAGAALVEPSFTRGEALRTPAFWLLSLYTMAVFPVQAGISLHQAPLPDRARARRHRRPQPSSAPSRWSRRSRGWASDCWRGELASAPVSRRRARRWASAPSSCSA